LADPREKQRLVRFGLEPATAGLDGNGVGHGVGLAGSG
jgi:hypothetical protein